MKPVKTALKLFLLIAWLILFVIQTVPAQEGLPPEGHPLSLQDCITLALTYHPLLSAGQASIEVQKARVEQALSAYYPQIDFKAGYNTATANYSGAGASTHNWKFHDLFSTGPSLNQLIYDFGRTADSVKINRENLAAEQYDLETVRQNVIFNVQQAYYGVLQSLELIQVARETLTQNQERLTQAEGFYTAGTRPKIDVTKAEVDLANAELALIRSQNNYQVARAALNNALGLKEGLRFAVDEQVDFSPRPVLLEEILETALVNRPEMLQLKAKQRGQEAAIGLARAGHYPTLSGSVSNTWRTDTVPNDFAWDWSIGASLTVPIFSGFSTQSRVTEARAQLRNLAAREESLRQEIYLEAEEVFLNFNEALQRIAVARKAMDQAKENYELARARYQVGIGQVLEINDAEVLLANARANHINALYDFKVSEARIEKTMGLNRQGIEK